MLLDDVADNRSVKGGGCVGMFLFFLLRALHPATAHEQVDAEQRKQRRSDRGYDDGESDDRGR